MKDQARTAEILAAHADELIGRTGALRRLGVTDAELEEMAPLFRLAEQVQRSMPPVHPSAAFVRSLGQELVRSARAQAAATRRMRRGVVIGAAAVGSLVSIASVVGAVAFLIARSRARAHSQ